MDLQFYSNIRSSLDKPYTINIYNTYGYTGSTIQLLVSSCSITRQNSGIFDPIISSGCKVEFINNLTDSQLSDIFNNYEKSFICEVIDVNNSITVFYGNIATDIISKNIGINETLVLEFSDYLKKLDQTTSDKVDGRFIYLDDLLIDNLNNTGIEQNLIVNASLHPNGTTVNQTTSYITDCLIDTNNFIDGEEIDNGKDVLNKILTPFNSYLYSFDNNYIIQNYRDIDNNSSRNWLLINSNDLSATSIISDKQIISEDNNDFDLFSGSIGYEAGLAEFDLNLKQKLYDNLIQNNFDEEIDVVFTGIVPTDQANGQWYYYQPSTGYSATFGNGWGEIGNYVKVNFPIPYTVPIGSNFWSGDYFFGKKCRITLDRSEANPQNTLSLEGIVRRNIIVDYSKDDRYCLPFSVKILSGINKGKYVKIDDDGSVILYTNVVGGVYEDIPRVIAYGSFLSYDTTVKCTTTIDFTNLLIDFGTETDVDILVLFHQYYLQPFPDDVQFGTRYYNSQLVGNVKAKYSCSLDDNSIVSTLSTNYTKKISTDLHIFDTQNSNYTNSLFTTDYDFFNRVMNWKSDIWINDNWKTLYLKYLEGVLNFYLKTREKLVATIQTEIPVKPLALIELSNNTKQYFLTKIVHDLANDTYQIEGYEYGIEDINVTE